MANLPEAILAAKLCQYVMDYDTVNTEVLKGIMPDGFKSAVIAHEGNSSVMVLVSAKRVYVVWRATEWDDVGDHLDNFYAKKHEIDGAVGSVHAGFYRHYLRTKRFVSRQVEEGIRRHHLTTPPIFTGHSLGATCASLHARLFNYPSVTYVFGSPRFADKVFADHYADSKKEFHRFSVLGDPITSLPTVFRWRHVSPVHLLTEGQIRFNLPRIAKIILTIRNLIFGLLGNSRLSWLPGLMKNHAITLYIERLEKRVNQ